MPEGPRGLRDPRAPVSGVLVADPSLRIISVNHAFCQMTGFDDAELVGRRPPYPFWSALEADRAQACMQEAADKGGDFELAIRTRDRRLFDASVSLTPVRDAAGALIAYAASYTDLSGVRAQERLERAVQDLVSATEVAKDDPRIAFDRVAAHVAALIGAPSAAIVRFEGDRGIIVGARAHHAVPLPDELPLNEPSATASVALTGRPAREDYADAQCGFAARARDAGMRGGLAVPVHLHGKLWGCLGVIYDRPEALPEDAERLLERCADLASLVLVNADAWSALQRRASTDSLTGLLNHRAFYERLGAEYQRALRHERPLALVVLDLDDFKTLNDTLGHQAGDRALHTVAQTLVREARSGDVAARLGGDEFAVIAPDVDETAALALAQRLRASAAEALAAVGLPLTLSCGVADVRVAESVDDLVRLADGALYHAKHHGRDQAVSYAPGLVIELSYEQALNARVLSAAQAIGRAISAKNGHSREHAEQVAHVADHVAARLGWDVKRRARLREAALLHDVGKLALPNALLANQSRYTPEEFEQMKTHVTLGAQLTEGFLDDEQLRWLRAHHERPDGSGYPSGLAGRDIPDGARVLAVADAYDSITREHTPTRPPQPPSSAVAELRRCAHRQFDAFAVDAVADWVAADGTERMQRPAK